MALLVVLVVVVVVTLGDEVVLADARFFTVSLGLLRLTGLVWIMVCAGPKELEAENEMKKVDSSLGYFGCVRERACSKASCIKWTYSCCRCR